MNTKNTTKASLTRTDSKSELRKSQMQILQALADGRARTKAQIMKDSGVRNWLCSLIGAVPKTTCGDILHFSPSDSSSPKK
jgi:hypothetical protein